ncbi:MAG TPA: FAD-dependent oxidoreductase [Steroidobacteraceae bacterium]|nr:FAD-dependent oxidoreductase [Steroidobacteraceae bacterium]
MKSQARVIVIGGGAVGCSALYHLTQLGITDVVLLERDELTAGSTWHAAGNVPNFSTSWSLLRMQRYTTRLYADLAQLTGYDINYHVTGSIRLAHTRDRVDEFRHVISQARAQGTEFELLSPEQIAARHPFIQTDDIRAGLWDPYDGDIDPAQMTQALAKGARDKGAEIHRRTRVTAIERASSGEWRVITDRGVIQAESVINAAGYRGGEVAAMVGQYLPITVMSHQYLVTEDIPALAQRGMERLPLLRDPDVSFYLRQERHGLLLGPYEWQATPHWLDGIPNEFANQLFEDDLGRLEKYIVAACERVPVLGSVGVKTVVNGPIPYAPDGNPLLGPAPSLKGFFHCCAFTFGIAQAGGAGKLIAEWVVNGQPEWDVWALDSRRYLEFANARYSRAKAIETYQEEYGVGYPIEERLAGRPAKVSPLYQRLQGKGARFGARGGWERAVYFGRSNDPERPEASFRRPSWHAAVARECAAVARQVGVLDLPGFSRFDVTGPGAREWLDHLIAGNLPRIGRCGLGYLCAPNGGIVTEMTVTALDEDHYWLLGAASGERHDEHWLRDHLGRGAGVRLENLTGRYGCLVVVGPQSRDLLTRVTGADLANESFPWLTTRLIDVAYAKVQALRINYVGELGWELHVPVEHLASVYEALWEEGASLGLIDFGLYAVESLRLEKCYRSWKADLTTDYTPLTASLDRFVRLDKTGGFIGQEALRGQCQRGIAERFVPLLVDAADADASPVSVVFKGQTPVGLVTSGGYGYRLERSIALAYVRTEFTTPGEELEVEILGERRRAVVAREPLYDPGNTRLRS